MKNIQAINEAKLNLEAANLAYSEAKGKVSEELQDQLFDIVMDAEDSFISEIKKETPQSLLRLLTNAAKEFKFRKSMIDKFIKNQAF